MSSQSIVCNNLAIDGGDVELDRTICSAETIYKLESGRLGDNEVIVEKKDEDDEKRSPHRVERRADVPESDQSTLSNFAWVEDRSE